MSLTIWLGLDCPLGSPAGGFWLPFACVVAVDTGRTTRGCAAPEAVVFSATSGEDEGGVVDALEGARDPGWTPGDCVGLDPPASDGLEVTGFTTSG